MWTYNKSYYYKKSAAILFGIFLSTAVSSQVNKTPQPPHIDRHIQSFLDASKGKAVKPMEKMTAAEAQMVLSGVQSSVKADLSGVNVFEKTITEDGGTVKLTIVKPGDSKGLLPAFLYFHGGGWMLGDFQTSQRLVRDLVVFSGVAAVFVNYALSPEAQYPVAINQAYSATKWIAEHGSEVGIDGKRLAVAGNSSGGNMATVVALMAKAKKGPELKLQVLMWPITDADFGTGSYRQFAANPILTRNVMIWFWNNYLPDAKKRGGKYVSPLRAKTEELRGLPPALILTAENDVLRDEGEAYARKLDEAGVDVIATRYNGMVHDWALLNPFSQIPSAQSAIFQAASELKKALQ